MKKPDVLRKESDFKELFNKGKSSGSRYVVLLYKKNGLENNRKAFVSSKKVGNSVTRNHARRLMREAYRRYEDQLPSGFDILLIARNTISMEVKCADVEKSIAAALKRAGLIG